MTRYWLKPVAPLLLTSVSLAWCLLGQPAQAQPGTSVTLQGMFGNKALLIINGGAPKALAVGESHQGVRLLSVGAERAEVELNGQRLGLRLGEAQASVGTSNTRSRQIVLSAASGGHFITAGAINGRAVQFMVDTGATSVALGADEAQRIGLDYRSGRPVRLNTANGVAMGWQVKLNSIRIGEVEVFDVDAVVAPQSISHVLLGNSFLSRFQMRRDNEQMVLERRF